MRAFTFSRKTNILFSLCERVYQKPKSNACSEVAAEDEAGNVDKHEPRYRPIKSGCKNGIYSFNYANLLPVCWEMCN